MSVQGYLRQELQQQQHLEILQQQELLQHQQQQKQQQQLDLLVNSPTIIESINNDVLDKEWNVYISLFSLIIIIILIIWIILNEYSEYIIRFYHDCRFHINDKKARLKGCIRRKLLEKQLLDRTIKLRMSPYIASLPTNHQEPIKEFNLHSMKPIQPVVQEYIITIQSHPMNTS